MWAVSLFPDLSSRAIADMCGVSIHSVADYRPAGVQNAHVTGADGKQYPARRPQIKTPAQEEAFYEKGPKEAPGTRHPDRRLDRIARNHRKPFF
jgi:hypothetical protein